MRTVERRKVSNENNLMMVINDTDNFGTHIKADPVSKYCSLTGELKYKANTTFKMGISSKFKIRQFVIK